MNGINRKNNRQYINAKECTDPMRWYSIENDYLFYLKQGDGRTPKSDYGDNRFKPFFGPLMETKDFYYVAPISHATPQRMCVRNAIDYQKIFNPSDGKFIAAINLNRMFPIPKNEVLAEKMGIKQIGYDEILQHMPLKTEAQKNNYIALLKTELSVINTLQESLAERAVDLYVNKCRNLNEKLAKRCLDFEAMEKYSVEYEKELAKIQESIKNNVMVKAVLDAIENSFEEHFCKEDFQDEQVKDDNAEQYNTKMTLAEVLNNIFQNFENSLKLLTIDDVNGILTEENQEPEKEESEWDEQNCGSIDFDELY